MLCCSFTQIVKHKNINLYKTNYNMKNKHKLSFYALVIFFAIYSCDKKTSEAEITQTETTETETTETIDTPTVETELATSIAGTYSFGGDGEKGPGGSVLIYPVNENSALFLLDINRGAPSYNSGQLFGEMKIEDNIGTYVDPDLNCLLKFEFSANQLIVSYGEGQNDCGFGNGVYANNTYSHTDKSVPTHFTNGEGEEIQFEGLTVEKYKQL